MLGCFICFHGSRDAAFPRPFSATRAGDVCHRKHLHPYMSVCQGLVLRPTSPPLPSHLAEAVGGQVGWVHCTVRGSRGGHSSALSQPRKPPAAPSSSGAGCSTQPSPAPPAAPAGPTGDQHHCRSPLPLHNKPCDRASCCCFWALLTRPGTHGCRPCLQRVLPAPASPPELPQCHQHLHMAPAPPGGPVCPWPCTWQRCPAGLCHAGLCHGVGTGLSAPSLSPRQHRAVKMWGLRLCPRLPPSSLQRVWGSPSAPRAQPSLGLHPALQQQPKAQGRVPVAHRAHRTHRWSRDRLSTRWSGARLPAAAPTLAEAPGTGRTRGCSRSPHPTGAGQHSHVSRQPWPRWPWS